MEIKMENQNNYRTSDLKIFCFIKTISPESFIGINRNPGNKVTFIFKNSKKLTQQINSYWQDKQFTISPLQLFQNFDVGKTLIFGGSED